MVWEFTLDIFTLAAVGAGWLFAWLLLLVIIAILVMTPAKHFLKAALTRSPIAFIKYRDGNAEFKVGKQEVSGVMNIKDLGPLFMVEGSHVREKASKVAVFEAFAESSTTIPKEYASIIEELREMGFPLSTFKQYHALVDLAVDEKKRASYRALLPADEQISFDEKMKQLIEKEINIKPYKTYKTFELASMFPYNMNPAYVEHYSTAQLVAQQKKFRMNRDLLIAAGFGGLLLIIGAVIAWRFLQGDTVPAQTIVQISPDAIRAAMETANTTIQNSSLVI